MSEDNKPARKMRIAPRPAIEKPTEKPRRSNAPTPRAAQAAPANVPVSDGKVRGLQTHGRAWPVFTP